MQYNVTKVEAFVNCLKSSSVPGPALSECYTGFLDSPTLGDDELLILDAALDENLIASMYKGTIAECRRIYYINALVHTPSKNAIDVSFRLLIYQIIKVFGVNTTSLQLNATALGAHLCGRDEETFQVAYSMELHLNSSMLLSSRVSNKSAVCMLEYRKESGVKWLGNICVVCNMYVHSWISETKYHVALKANSGFYLNTLSDGAVQIHLQSRSCADVRVPYTISQICSLSKPGSIQKVVFSDLVQGSHDSFSFYIDEASPVGPEQPETVQNFVSVFGTVAKKLMRKWLATQTMNFTGQLGAGIRYFDLRISTKPRDPDNELYFAHGLFSAKVNEGLEEINAFLTDHHKEVVFLDFNHFYGMQKYHHEKLVQMLKDIYGNKMCPAIFAQEVSLKYLWEKDYQVLVFYHSPVALEVPFLWPGQMMPAPWANTTDPEKLIQFLQASITERRKKGSFFISQVVLTPKASTVVKGVASGLRETITERALPAMMQWVRTQKPGESGINIVTADFVELGDFISTVIKLNYVFDEGEANT
ncbi:PI-PLC X domain-containing protein 3 [Hyaena hyaena]|nr:PI-PLC X domain-containing protein 3 [Hyaena hyaena]